MNIVRVALDVPLPTLFDYMVGEGVRIEVGQRVIVPFGRRQAVGVVMERVQNTVLLPDRIKPIDQVLSDSEPLSAELLNLMRFCSDYYHYPIGQVVLSALPTRMRLNRPVINKPVKTYHLSVSGAQLNLDDFPKRKVVQRRILSKLAEDGECVLVQLKLLSPTAGVQLKSLIAEGWVVESEQSVKSIEKVAQNYAGAEAKQAVTHGFSNVHELTEEQKLAVDAVAAERNYACFVLFGVTGSGKTEVYVHMMHNVLKRGGQVLLLVPEINLTPQLEQYFRLRFTDIELVSLHSGMSEGERLHNWQQAKSGRARIVLGTRLSVFAEMPELSIIIVDEEHDSSFKQQDGLRYSARDVAVFRANQRGIPIVLGSATPSLESYHNALIGRYRLLKLTGRAQTDARLPSVRCVNINQTVMHHGVSENLLREIDERIKRNEQSLLFINRRGYAPVLMCTDCGWLSECKHCAGKMVLHLNDKRLRCHHCGYQIHLPKQCPECGNAELHPVGSGTQRIESVLVERLPHARILRVDRDSTRNKRAWQKMREQIHANEVDILVGTQMLAKGHDFPELTLVGVLNPDGALYSSDFRAAERLFAQLAQVAGRAGRANKPGEVLVQTSFPDHPLFRALQTHDFEGWAKIQLAERELAGFPPFVFQAMLRAEGRSESEVYGFLNKARDAAQQLQHDVEIFGVVPAAMPRRANHIRVQMLIQAESRKTLQQFLRAWQAELSALCPQKIHCVLDVDPMEF